MEEKIIQKTVYLAKDGKEFLNKEECRKYEEEFLNKVSYFAISYNFDLTEGRGFQSLVYVAVVPSRNDSAVVIANKYAIDVLNDGVFAGQGCQGYGLQETYSLRPITKDMYDANEGTIWGWGCDSIHGKQILISEKPIEGFPEPFNYKKEWGIK